MTCQHIGILLTIAGTGLLAFSVKVKRSYSGPAAEVVDSSKDRDNVVEITETKININQLRWGLALVSVGALLQW